MLEGGTLSITDDQLMTQGARGDDNAYRILVQRWQNQVFTFLLSMLGSPEDAQDICQETFIRMIGSANTYRPQGQFQSWLFRIAGNQARSRLRRRKVLLWLSLDNDRQDPPSPTLNAHQEMERSETRADVTRSINKLPPRQREALMLKQYQGMKYGEIANTMGLSVGAVQMLLHRAMTALRNDFLPKEKK